MHSIRIESAAGRAHRSYLLHAYADLALPVEKGSDIRNIFAKGRIATLERAIGKAGGKDVSLWQEGPFSGEIYPDLPVAMTWSNLLTQNFPRSVFFPSRREFGSLDRRVGLECSDSRKPAHTWSRVQESCILEGGFHQVGDIRQLVKPLGYQICWNPGVSTAGLPPAAEPFQNQTS